MQTEPNSPVRRALRRGGYTLLELMMAAAIGTIALSGLARWMYILRLNHNEAMAALQQADVRSGFRDILIRGGLGTGTGIGSALQDSVTLTEDAGTGTRIRFKNLDERSFEFVFGAAGAFTARELDDTGKVVQERNFGNMPVQISSVSISGGRLLMNYKVKKIRRGLEYQCSDQMEWNF